MSSNLAGCTNFFCPPFLDFSSFLAGRHCLSVLKNLKREDEEEKSAKNQFPGRKSPKVRRGEGFCYIASAQKKLALASQM